MILQKLLNSLIIAISGILLMDIENKKQPT